MNQRSTDSSLVMDMMSTHCFSVEPLGMTMEMLRSLYIESMIEEAVIRNNNEVLSAYFKNVFPHSYAVSVR
jgi:hypothetical protein